MLQPQEMIVFEKHSARYCPIRINEFALLSVSFTTVAFCLQRDTWEQTAADTVSQAEGLCSDSLAPVVAPASLSSPDSGSPVNYRAASRGPATPGSQPYLHSLEEVHYPTLYPPTSGYTCSTYMSTPGDLASKIAPLSSEESDHGPVLSDAPSWSKDDAGSWSPYDIRRAY